MPAVIAYINASKLKLVIIEPYSRNYGGFY